jgi:hypothetical protein
MQGKRQIVTKNRARSGHENLALLLGVVIFAKKSKKITLKKNV